MHSVRPYVVSDSVCVCVGLLVCVCVHVRACMRVFIWLYVVSSRTHQRADPHPNKLRTGAQTNRWRLSPPFPPRSLPPDLPPSK